MAYEGSFYFPYPDSIGSSCDYQPFSFYLGGKRTYYGLPNNPNYDLGPLAGSSCDTITGISPTPALPGGEEEPALHVFYHSSWQKLFVNAQHIKGKICLLQVFDMNGKEVFSFSKQTQPPYYTGDVNCAAFCSKGDVCGEFDN